MNSQNEKLAKIKEAFEELPKTLKAIGTIGSLCGFIYLLAYTREVGIPFPLELSVLPTVLLLVGVMSLLGTAIVVSGVLVPAVLADDPLEATRPVLLASGTDKNRALVRIKRYILCAWIPMAVALLGMLMLAEAFNIGPWRTWVATLLLGVAILWVVSTSNHFVTQKDKRAEYIATMLGQTLLSVFAYLLAIMIILALFPEFGKWEAWKGLLIVLAVFTPIHLLITMPHDPTTSRKILLPPFDEYKATPATAIACGILVFLVMLSVLIFPVNAQIGRAVLYAFGAGGEIPTIICMKDVPPSQVAQRIAFGSDKCSEPLVILFDAGDRLYVAKPLPKQKDKTQAHIAVLEPIYLRQDQILGKIYIHETKKNREGKPPQ